VVEGTRVYAKGRGSRRRVAEKGVFNGRKGLGFSGCLNRLVMDWADEI
jgi:hypothetical protein